MPDDLGGDFTGGDRDRGFSGRADRERDEERSATGPGLSAAEMNAFGEQERRGMAIDRLGMANPAGVSLSRDPTTGIMGYAPTVENPSLLGLLTRRAANALVNMTPVAPVNQASNILTGRSLVDWVGKATGWGERTVTPGRGYSLADAGVSPIDSQGNPTGSAPAGPTGGPGSAGPQPGGLDPYGTPEDPLHAALLNFGAPRGLTGPQLAQVYATLQSFQQPRMVG